MLSHSNGPARGQRSHGWKAPRVRSARDTLSRVFPGQAALQSIHLTVGARLVSLPVVTWGSLRVVREDPRLVRSFADARAPVGSPTSHSSDWRWVLASDNGVLGHKQVGEQSTGALTDVFVVVARYREMPSHP
jgi:hypothetical protein